MISFFDIFRWDRFVAPSMAELCFWLLSLVAVLAGVFGLVSGFGLVTLDPVAGLLTIAASIIGPVGGIVAARLFCEFILMAFRINENLLEIRDAIQQGGSVMAPAAEPQRPAAPVFAQEPAFTADAETPEPVRVVHAPAVRAAEPRHEEARPAPEHRAVEHRSPAPFRTPAERSAETNALEARLAEIRARRAAIHPPVPRLSPPPEPVNDIHPPVVIPPLPTIHDPLPPVVSIEEAVVDERIVSALRSEPPPRVEPVRAEAIAVETKATPASEISRVELAVAQVALAIEAPAVSAPEPEAREARRAPKKAEPRRKPAAKRPTANDVVEVAPDVVAETPVKAKRADAG